MAKLDELKAKMAEAVKVFNETGDMSGIQAVSKEMDRAKAELAKAQAEQSRKEAEQLAGKREALANTIHQQVKALGLDKAIRDIKGWGFTYKIDGAVPNELDVSYKAVQLSTATVKTRTGGTGGGAGKSKDEYGKSLAEIFEEFATAEDRQKLDNAESNSKQWQVKVAVKKRAIAEGLLKPVK